jgi:hypothetical protein
VAGLLPDGVSDLALPLPNLWHTVLALGLRRIAALHKSWQVNPPTLPLLLSAYHPAALVG